MINDSRILLPHCKKNAHIGLLGGSFNPPHLCHQLLALSFLALEPLDEIWVIPCANHAFKGDLSSFDHRFNMCEIAFKRINQIRVLDLESKLETPNYTIETINIILQKRPDLTLFLAIGSDLIKSFDKWHRAEEITKRVNVVVFERESYPLTDLPVALGKARIHAGYSLPDTNSTSLRDFLRHNDKNAIRPYLDRDVVRYIEEHRLYATK